MYLRDISKVKILELEPQPWFVVKSLIFSPARYQDWKIFINVTHNSQVPTPKTLFDPLKTFNEIMNNNWEIPIITSPMGKDTDKKLNPCLVFDCCINSNILTNIENNIQLRDILIEWCLESVELREDLVILRDENIKLPKMKYKGSLPPKVIKFDNTENDENSSESNSNKNSFSAWKNEMLEKQEIEERESELTSLFPEKSQKQNKPNFIQDITDEYKNNNANKKNDYAHNENNKKSKRIIKYNVSMRKTNEINNYKLKIEIEIVNKDTRLLLPIKDLDLQVNYMKSENNLVIENRDLVYSEKEKLCLELPNIKFNPSNMKIFNLNNSKLAIFI